MGQEELEPYQQACLARNSLCLAPPPVGRGRTGFRTTPGSARDPSRSPTDGDPSNPASPSSSGSGSGSLSTRSGWTSGVRGGGVGAIAVSAPDRPFAKDNLTHQLGPQPRPSYKRLASMTLGPGESKSMRTESCANVHAEGAMIDDVDGQSGRGGGGGGGYELGTAQRPGLQQHQRKRSNSSPTSAASRPPNLFAIGGFPAHPAFSSSSSASPASHAAAIA